MKKVSYFLFCQRSDYQSLVCAGAEFKIFIGCIVATMLDKAVFPLPSLSVGLLRKNCKILEPWGEGGREGNSGTLGVGGVSHSSEFGQNCGYFQLVFVNTSGFHVRPPN